MLLFVASALLAAAEPAATAAPTPAPVPAAKPKKVCRMEEPVTGSITPKRVCVTVPQQARTAPKAAQDVAREKQTPSANGSAN